MNDKSGQKKVASMKSLTYSITCTKGMDKDDNRSLFVCKRLQFSCVYLCILYLGLLEMGVAKCTVCCQEWVKN